MSSFKKKNIVIIGGGNGSSISIRGMKQFVDIYELSAIVPVSDSGSVSGELTRSLSVLPPGDLIRAILAMSPYDFDMLKDIFYTRRYTGPGDLNGCAIGHAFLALTERHCGTITQAIDIFSTGLHAMGMVYPATLGASTLCARISTGDVVQGEHHIDRPMWDRAHGIEELWLDPVVTINRHAHNAIVSADIIIFGPGSLYTSVIASLLPYGMREALETSSAKYIYVGGNAIERYGEVCPETLSGRVEVLHQYLPRQLDVVIVNASVLTAEQEAYYHEKQWKQIVMDIENVTVPVLSVPYEKIGGGLDPELLGKAIHEYLIS